MLIIILFSPSISIADEDAQRTGLVRKLFNLKRNSARTTKEAGANWKSLQGSWEVYDIVVEGISLVNNYRNQFNSIMSNGSVDKLFKTLRKKVDSL